MVDSKGAKTIIERFGFKDKELTTPQYLEFKLDDLKKIISAIEKEESDERNKLGIACGGQGRYTLNIKNVRKNLWHIEFPKEEAQA